MKEEKEEGRVYSLDDIDKEALVVCAECGIAFDQETAPVCPNCKGKGGNPDDEDEEEGLFGGIFDEK